MDVVLITSGPRTTPYSMYRTLGAYKIAQSLRKNNYSSQVIDFVNFMTEEEFMKCCSKFINSDTKVLALSTTFLMYGSMLSINTLPPHVINAINYFTNLYPNLKIVFGGCHSRTVTETDNITTKYECVIEYGEDIIVDLLNFYTGKGPQPIFEFLIKPWATYKVYKTPLVKKYKIEEDNFTFTKEDCIVKGETLPIEISRGCIFKCKFCNHLLLGRGKLDYLRSMELVKNELENNYKNWGVTNYFIICDTFNDTEYKMNEWYKMINSLSFKIKYTAYVRADLLDRYPDTAHILADTGLTSVFHGIETLNPKSAVSIGKGWSGKRAKEFIPNLYHNIWNKKILQSLSFIIGLPHDRHEDFFEILNWFEENDLYNLVPHGLGLYKIKNRNQSEFERNYENYGYKFLDDSRPYNWSNDYWNLQTVADLIDKNQNRIHKMSSKHGSWEIMLLAQYGFSSEQLTKENQKNIKAWQYVIKKKEHLEKYMNLLLSL